MKNVKIISSTNNVTSKDISKIAESDYIKINDYFLDNGDFSIDCEKIIVSEIENNNDNKKYYRAYFFDLYGKIYITSAKGVLSSIWSIINIINMDNRYCKAMFYQKTNNSGISYISMKVHE